MLSAIQNMAPCLPRFYLPNTSIVNKCLMTIRFGPLLVSKFVTFYTNFTNCEVMNEYCICILYNNIYNICFNLTESAEIMVRVC